MPASSGVFVVIASTACTVSCSSIQMACVRSHNIISPNCNEGHCALW